jgi:hypothetical protein
MRLHHTCSTTENCSDWFLPILVQAAKQVTGKEQAGAIAKAKAANERAEDEVTYRHGKEQDAFEEADPDAFEEASADAKASEKIEETPPVFSNKGDGSGDSKKSKAQKKREKERAKAKERDDRIAAEKAGAGPSPREVYSFLLLCIDSYKFVSDDACSKLADFLIKRWRRRLSSPVSVDLDEQ